MKRNLVVTVFALVFSGFAIGPIAALNGCGYGKPACTIIDAMHEACTVVRFLGPDGKVHETPISSSELKAMAVRVEAARLSADAGAP